MNIIIILLLLTIAQMVNSQVDDDCFCQISPSVKGLFVDTCGSDKNCDIYNRPTYYNKFMFNRYDTYGLSDSDTGEVSLSKLLNSNNDYLDSFIKLNNKFGVKKIERYILGNTGSNFYYFDIRIISEGDSINQFMIEHFDEHATYFPNVGVLNNVKKSNNSSIKITVNNLGDVILEGIVKAYDIKIINYLGSEVYKKKLNNNSVTATHVITELQNGFYFVIIDGILYEKLFLTGK